MSTDYLRRDPKMAKQKEVFFPGERGATPWTDVQSYTRFHAALPSYPFRTLSPRSTALLQTGKLSAATSIGGGGGSGMDFDYASCLLPAHTQCTVVLKRRPNNASLLNFFYPWDTPAAQGTLRRDLTAAQRDGALTFVGGQRAVAAGGRENVNLKITGVTISLANITLLVGPPPFPPATAPMSLTPILADFIVAGVPPQVQGHEP